MLSNRYNFSTIHFWNNAFYTTNVLSTAEQLLERWWTHKRGSTNSILYIVIRKLSMSSIYRVIVDRLQIQLFCHFTFNEVFPDPFAYVELTNALYIYCSLNKNCGRVLSMYKCIRLFLFYLLFFFTSSNFFWKCNNYASRKMSIVFVSSIV